MNSKFADYIGKLPGLAQCLISSNPLIEAEISVLRRPGIYVFSEGGVVLYVGRTRNLRDRYKAHCHESSGENKAAFAFRLARIASENLTASYRPEGSRKSLMLSPKFASAFEAAKRQIASMEIRFIEVEDPVTQHLLELYVSLATGSVHNSFETS